jgi:hypothetical protein
MPYMVAHIVAVWCIPRRRRRRRRGGFVGK